MEVEKVCDRVIPCRADRTLLHYGFKGASRVIEHLPKVKRRKLKQPKKDQAMKSISSYFRPLDSVQKQQFLHKPDTVHVMVSPL